ncbi:cerebral cavernous malformations 2 protein-like [Mercenaria mercenaria]|uniref:cerebral cavernous malformations 2 protein-like n=1 Tax=Mercenaria mercenaria TaxID=6596 RepID=UPI00234F378F|nr:cerebral cavernous malformations 2 protein-like [Mercenaria mercenaria]
MLRNPRSSVIRSDELRPLRTAELTPRGLRIESNNFDEKEHHYVEFDCKYLGNIPGVPSETDTTNRTEVLKIIDRGKKQGLIPLHINSEHEAILYLSKEKVQVNRRDLNEEMLLLLPLHEIAHVCYVQEERLHILAIKHGTPERLNLAVFLCDGQDTAEAICALVSCCFHVVYSAVMIDLIEDTIDNAIRDDNRSFSSDATTTGQHPQFVSGSCKSLEPDSPGPIGSEISGESQAEVLREYMWQLNAKLKPEELKMFSTHLKNWNYSSNKLQEFCENLYKLYGPERRHLLAGMYPFIPERDCQYFEKFLKKHDVSLPGLGTLSSLPGYPPLFYTRSISDISVNSNTGDSSNADFRTSADFDLELDAMGKNFERIEVSVGETTQSYLQSVFDKNSKI